MMVLSVMLQQTVFTFESFIAQVARKCSSFMFHHAIFVISLHRESFGTFFTPVAESPDMPLEVKSQSSFPTVRLVALGTVVSSCRNIEYREDIIAVPHPGNRLTWYH